LTIELGAYAGACNCTTLSLYLTDRSWRFFILEVKLLVCYCYIPLLHAALSIDHFRVGTLLFPGTGPILAAISSAASATPVVIGKPNPALIRGILAQFHMDQSRTAMVGDR
jgi:hypothetical protein